jgi:hypothetical protein
VYLERFSRAHCEETKANGSHELACCHGGRHVGSCAGVELLCQCYVILQGAIAVAVGVLLLVGLGISLHVQCAAVN